ncbi:MAG: hypothetical protein ABH817_00030 [archaeon]
MKKGQLKIQEMAFVLIAIVILFALVLLFFTRIELFKVKGVAEQTREERALFMLRAIAAMPELRCSVSTSESACIDLDKLKAFEELNAGYKPFWRNNFIQKIRIDEVYPGKNEYLLFEDKLNEESTQGYSTFIPLCQFHLGRTNCSMGRITITITTT